MNYRRFQEMLLRTCLLGLGIFCAGHADASIPTMKPRILGVQSAEGCVLSDAGVRCWGTLWAQLLTHPPMPLTSPRYLVSNLDKACAIADEGLVCWLRQDRGAKWVETDFLSPLEVAMTRDEVCVIDGVKGLECLDLRDRQAAPLAHPKLSQPRELRSDGYGFCALSENQLWCWGGTWEDGKVKFPLIFNHPRALAAQGRGVCLIDDNGPWCLNEHHGTQPEQINFSQLAQLISPREIVSFDPNVFFEHQPAGDTTNYAIIDDGGVVLYHHTNEVVTVKRLLGTQDAHSLVGNGKSVSFITGDQIQSCSNRAEKTYKEFVRSDCQGQDTMRCEELYQGLPTKWMCEQIGPNNLTFEHVVHSTLVDAISLRLTELARYVYSNEAQFLKSVATILESTAPDRNTDDRQTRLLALNLLLPYVENTPTPHFEDRVIPEFHWEIQQWNPRFSATSLADFPSSAKNTAVATSVLRASLIALKQAVAAESLHLIVSDLIARVGKAAALSDDTAWVDINRILIEVRTPLTANPDTRGLILAAIAASTHLVAGR